MIKIPGVKRGLSVSLGKIGITFLFVTGALTFCACNEDNQQTKTLPDSLESVVNEESLEGDSTESNKAKFEKVNPVAVTIDVMQSQAIGIQNQQCILTMSGDETTLEESENADLEESEDDSNEKPASTDNKKPNTKNDPKKEKSSQNSNSESSESTSVPSNNTSSAGEIVQNVPQAPETSNQSQQVEPTSTQTPPTYQEDNKGSLVEPTVVPENTENVQEKSLEPNVNPTVNESAETAESNSDVGYSKDDENEGNGEPEGNDEGEQNNDEHGQLEVDESEVTSDIIFEFEEDNGSEFEFYFN